jgi:hypothetical protein
VRDEGRPFGAALRGEASNRVCHERREEFG